MRNYRRRIRRFVKRLTRSIFRPKRRYRNSRRRRIRKSRRYYRRRKSARVVRKKAVSSRSIIAGKLYRTYYFPVSLSQLLKSDGTFSTSNYYIRWEPLRYNGMTWNELTQTDEYRYLWTGAANFLTVTQIPEIQSRLFGFDQYTLIRLDWLGMFRLFAIGDYTNQADCLKEDLGKYAYYKPISITVELIPKFSRPLAKTIFQTPTSISLPSYHTFFGVGDESIRGWHGTVAEGVLALPSTNWLGPGQTADTPASVTSTISHYYDEDAVSHIGYIIPASGNINAHPTDLPTTQLYQEYWTELYNSFFGSAALVPSAEFVSSFRRAPYKRGRIVAGKKISFTYKLDNLHKHAGTYFPGTTTVMTWGDMKYFKDGSSVYKGRSAVNNPFDHYREVRPDGWLNANIQYYGIPRVGEATMVDEPYQDARLPFIAPLHQYQPMEFANVFIPGMSVSTIFRFFDIRFKYKCVYRSKEFDLE